MEDRHLGKLINTTQGGSERLYRAMLAAQPNLLFYLNGEGVHLDFHAPSPDMLYAKPEDIIGKSVFDLLPGDVAQSYMHHIRRTLERESTEVFEYSLAFPNGEEHVYEARIAFIDQSSVLAIVRDVSGQKKTEE